MVWWKSVCGAWTTSHRLHEINQLPCVFGCTDSKDTLSHYLVCPVLWQLAREVCPNEESSSVPSRHLAHIGYIMSYGAVYKNRETYVRQANADMAHNYRSSEIYK